MQVPVLVALNMMDRVRAAGHKLSVQNLQQQIGCPIISTVAKTEEGIQELKATILKTVQDPETAISKCQIDYAKPIEHAIAKLIPKIEPLALAHKMNVRWLALSMLEGDSLATSICNSSEADSKLSQQITELKTETEQALDDDLDISLADARYGFADKVVKATLHRAGRIARSTTDKVDQIVLNRILGIPIFLLMMYLMFMFTINIGGAFIDFFDQFTGALLVDGLGTLMSNLGSPDWFKVLIANGIGGGVQTVATFIPIIAFLYLFLSVLEDSGYMTRAAFVMDRFMRSIGLPGKAFVPLIVGFGCNVPSVMATRTLEQHRDRIMTILMSPFMSCGARLPVYALFAAAFFPTGGQNLVFLLYLIGIAMAVLTGLIMKHTLLQGHPTPFIMELPPYLLPTVKSVLLRTWDRTKSFMFRAGKIIVPMVLVLNFLNALGTDGSFGNENSDKSVLSEIGRTIAPAFSPMGLTQENWPAAVGIFTGILAKEAVVGTLDATYSALAKKDAKAAEEETPFNLLSALGEAFATIPANLGDAIGSWGDPLGLSVGNISSTETAAVEQEVATSTFGAMQTRFNGTAGAFAYLLFILLYFPCTAVIAAVYRETDMAWATFVAVWTTALAYVTATVFYQAATFTHHPGSSLAWIAGLLVLSLYGVMTLRYWGMKEQQRLYNVAATESA